jgi:hypothetical protein
VVRSLIQLRPSTSPSIGVLRLTVVASVELIRSRFASASNFATKTVSLSFIRRYTYPSFAKQQVSTVASRFDS